MKLKQNQTSTPVQTFETYVGATFYRQSNGEVLMAVAPNRPTPEAVAKAQFIDKTFVWEGSAANKAAKS